MLLTYYSHQTEKNRDECFNIKTNAGKQLLFLSLIRIFIQQIVRRKPVKTIAFIESHFVYWKPLLLVEAILLQHNSFLLVENKIFNCFVSANSRKLVSQFLIRLLASYPIVSISAFHILSTCQHLVQLLLSNLPVSTSACYYVILLLLSYHFGRIFFACQELTRLLVSTRYYRNFYLVSTALVSSCELDTFFIFSLVSVHQYLAGLLLFYLLRSI